MTRAQTTMVRVGATGALLAAVGLLSASAMAQVASTPRTPTDNVPAMTITGQTPAVGQLAPDFTLKSLDGGTVRLSEEVARGPIVLVVLRGFPTYQCPFCTRQFADYLARSDEFQASGARVLFIYPGPAEGLNAHATALVADRPLPAAYRILMDPDYAFTRAYDLRWDAPKETAYPSTFVIDSQGIVSFARTSRAHGERVPTAEVLAALPARPR